MFLSRDSAWSLAYKRSNFRLYSWHLHHIGQRLFARSYSLVGFECKFVAQSLCSDGHWGSSRHLWWYIRMFCSHLSKNFPLKLCRLRGFSTPNSQPHIVRVHRQLHIVSPRLYMCRLHMPDFCRPVPMGNHSQLGTLGSFHSRWVHKFCFHTTYRRCHFCRLCWTGRS